ncbi:MAG: NADH-quinone oxidoreductase subunit N [Variovorax sp.]|nr:NADH-quinone oxidoreductase subunit N [Variovorax sp.]
MPIGDLLPEIALLLGAVAAMLAATFLPRGRQWLCAPLALVALVAGGVLCATQWYGPARFTFSDTWALDGGSVAARLLIMATAAGAVLLSPDWFRSDRRHGEYYAMLLLSTLGAMLMAGAGDMLQLVMGVLLSSVTGYVMAAYHRDWALSLEAGMKYFLIGALANTLLMVGVALLFGVLGQTAYVAMATALGGHPSSGALLLGLTLVVIGLAFKLGAVPAHAWMPDVAEGAPAPAAAFLTTVPKIGAALGLARFLMLFPPEMVAWQPLIAALAVATMTLGNLAALGQTDVRRLIGWSSVSQSGYALMAIAVRGRANEALPALLFFLAGYAAAQTCAFAVVTHLRGRTELDHYQGLASARPWTAAALVVSFLSLVGIPPLAGFVGKLTLFVAALEGGYTWLAVAAVINTVVSLFYYLKVLSAMYFAPLAAPVAVLGRWSAVALWLSTLLALGLGLAAEPLLGALGSAALLP